MGEVLEKSQGRSKQPGPIYDAAMRGVLEGDAVATLHADLVMRVGSNRLSHVEAERRPSRDLAVRMLGYRWLIMRDHPEAVLTQHVILLGQRRIRRHPDPVIREFWRSVKVLLLREVDPAWLLTDVSLAPLAVLGRGSISERGHALAQALRLIQDFGGRRVRDLMEFAAVLARITLRPAVVDEIVEEAAMSSVESAAGEIFRGTEWGRSIHRLARQELLEDVIRERFGAHPDVAAIAHRMVRWPRGSAVHAVATAANLEELAQAQPPV